MKNKPNPMSNLFDTSVLPVLLRFVSRLLRQGFLPIFLGAFLSVANAQSESLRSLLQNAMSTHPDVLAKRNEERAAASELSGSKWGRFPGFSVQATSENSNQFSSTRTATLEQPIWTGGRITSAIDRADANLAVSQAAVLETQQSVLRETSSVFYEVLRLEARYKDAKSNETEHLRLQGVIERRVEAGVSPLTDLTQATARTQQAIADRIQIVRQLDTVRAQLDQLVGRRVGPLNTPKAFSVDNSLMGAALDRAREFSPSLKKLQLQIRVADADIDNAKAQIMPKLVAGYRKNIGTILPGQDGGGTFISLQAQTGGGLSALSGVDAAVARREAALEKVTAQDRALVQEVRASVGDIDAYSLQLKSLGRLLEDSDAVVASYLRQFQVGRRSWIEVLNAQREKTQAAFSLRDLEAAVNVSKIRLLLLVGQINAENLDGLNE
jgi:adhesin transport system outer membrane protein